MPDDVSLKALDKRVGGIEKKLDELEKGLRAAGDFKGLAAKVAGLEQICKVLMDARAESKATAAKMISDVVAKVSTTTLSPEEMRKLLDNERKAFEAQTKAMTDKMSAEAKAESQRMLEYTFKNVLESRLKSIEQRLASAESVANIALAQAGEAGARKK